MLYPFLNLSSVMKLIHKNITPFLRINSMFSLPPTFLLPRIRKLDFLREVHLLSVAKIAFGASQNGKIMDISSTSPRWKHSEHSEHLFRTTFTPSNAGYHPLHVIITTKKFKTTTTRQKMGLSPFTPIGWPPPLKTARTAGQTFYDFLTAAEAAAAAASRASVARILSHLP